MDKLPVLFLTVCSHTKEPKPEIFQYTTTESIIEELDQVTSNELLNRRKKSIDILKEDELFRNGRKVKYLPSNSMLSYTRDICLNGETMGFFLPAIKRYI